jgi:2-oxoglutarate ferredoxin oxidoreductase subunit alpha
MVAKRRNKLKKLASELPVPTVYGPAEGQILLVSWGSSKGPVQEAVKLARAAGHAISSVHIKYVHPMPHGLEEIFAGFRHVFVVELNDEGFAGIGQMGGLLRAHIPDAKIRGITKTDGLTWKVQEIVDRALEMAK